MKRSHAFIVLAILALASGGVVAQKQTWDYKVFQKDPVSGQFSKERFRTATVTLEEKDGKAVFRMIVPGKGDPCINQSDLPAEVQRGEQTLTITVRPTLAGCLPFRYIIRNDGSGGVRQNQREAAWVNDGLDHGLTPQR